MKFRCMHIDESGDLGTKAGISKFLILTATEPTGTKTSTKRHSDIQVLPVTIYTYTHNLNLSAGQK